MKKLDRIIRKILQEGDTYEKMAAKGKKAGNLKQGTVRKRLGIPKDEKIPLSKINKELSRLKKMDKDKDKKGVQLGDKNQKYYKALQLSKTLKTTTNVNENKFDKAAMDEYGKPFNELSIAQKQELLSYMNRETEKQFQTDYEKRRRGDYSDDMEGGMTDYQRRRMDENKFKVGDEIVYRGDKPGKVVHVFDKKSFINPAVEYKINYQDVGGTTSVRVRGKDIALKKDLDDMGRKYFGKDYDLDEGTCGYGEDGKIGTIPAGAHLQKEESEGDKEIRALEKEAEKYPKGDSRREVIQKKIGDLKSDKDYALPGSKADKKFSDMSDKEIDDEVRRLLNKGVGYKSSIYSNFINEDEIPSYLAKNIIFGKAVEDSVNFNDFQKRVYGILGPKYYKLTDQDALKNFYDSIRVTKPNMEEELFTPNEMGDEAVEREASSAAYESLQESLRKKLQDRLK